MKEIRYDNLDGLRVISCLCIIAMHIKANSNYNLNPTIDAIISSWTHFVPLFLMISGFSMFCGYYGNFKENSFDLNIFFSKRYKKLLPFFITLIVIDVAVDRSISHVIEGVTEATLIFGLLPNNHPEVIGVSWTLGVIFLFYMLFPFMVYICWTKKRAIISFVLSIILSLFCSVYYFTDKYVIESFTARHNFLYCSPFFIGGGVVFLYRDLIRSFVSRYRLLWLLGCICATIEWFITLNDNTGKLMLKNLILFLLWLAYAISVESVILNNKVMKYLSGVSLQLYLAQMVVFRLLEKLHIIYLCGNGWASLMVTWFLEITGLLIFIEIWKKLWIFGCRKLRECNCYVI